MLETVHGAVEMFVKRSGTAPSSAIIVITIAIVVAVLVLYLVRSLVHASYTYGSLPGSHISLTASLA